MNQRYSRLYKKNNGNGKHTGKKPSADRKREREKRLLAVGVFALCFSVVLFAFIFSFRFYYQRMKEKAEGAITEAPQPEPIVGAAALFPDLPISEEFLTVNSYSRPGLALTASPKYIVIHYTANPGSTAEQNRNYFENLKDTGETYASAQFVIGLEGEIIQCVPCNEMAYCSNNLNEMCISIEMCHPDDTGSFHDATYNNCVYLVAHLMNYYHLDMDHLIRHYDVTGKNCPKYFVEHEDRWIVFKDFVEEYRERFRKGETP